MLTLVLALLLWPQVPVSAQKDPTQVLQDLLARYGDNGSISVPQLRSLLAVLSLGQGAESSTPPQSNNSKVRINQLSFHLNHIQSKMAVPFLLGIIYFGPFINSHKVSPSPLTFLDLLQTLV